MNTIIILLAIIAFILFCGFAKQVFKAIFFVACVIFGFTVMANAQEPPSADENASGPVIQEKSGPNPWALALAIGIAGYGLGTYIINAEEPVQISYKIDF